MKNIGIGDVIVSKRNDQMVYHGLVKVFAKGGMKYYQTRGDSFFNLDKPVALKQIFWGR